MNTLPHCMRLAVGAVGLLWAPWVAAQTETVFQTVGMGTARSFAHTSLPGATGIDFSFSFAIAAAYPPEESHTLVAVFE